MHVCAIICLDVDQLQIHSIFNKANIVDIIHNIALFKHSDTDEYQEMHS